MDEKVIGNTTVRKFGLFQCPLVPCTKALHFCSGCFSVLQSCNGISSKGLLNKNLGFTKYSEKALYPKTSF